MADTAAMANRDRGFTGKQAGGRLVSLPRVVVRTHRPGRKVAKSLGALAILLALGYLLYVAGRESVPAERLTVPIVRTERGESNARLESTNQVLRKRVAILERAGQIERNAYAEVDHSLEQLQAEILDLREEVVFYRGIVASGQAGGLAIQSFQVQPDGGAREYAYRLVLTGDTKDGKVISGVVNLAVAGERGGRLTKLSLAELSDRKVPGISFQLRYFQKIRGHIRLPEDFIPHRVFVQVRAEGGTSGKVERTFDWPGPAG